MATRSPHLNKAWGRVKLGTYTLGDGALVVATVPSSDSVLKSDAKSKAGKSGAKVTTQGLEQRKGQIVVRFLRAAWDDPDGKLEAMLDDLDPAGPHRGGPFPFEYPGLGPGAPRSVLIKKMSRPIKWEGELGTVTLDWEACSLSTNGAGAGAGAVAGRRLTDLEAAALASAIELLRRRIVNTGLIAQNASTQAEKDAAYKDLNELQQLLLQKQNELQRGLIGAPAPTTETRNADKNATPSGPSASNGSEDTTVLHKSAKKAYSDPVTGPTGAP